MIQLQVWEEVTLEDEQGNERRDQRMVECVQKIFKKASDIDVTALEQEALQKAADNSGMVDKLMPLVGRKIVDHARTGNLAKRRKEKVEKL